jgi:hypothetical protein
MVPLTKNTIKIPSLDKSKFLQKISFSKNSFEQPNNSKWNKTLT